MYLGLAGLLFVIWIVCFAVLHIAAFGIHVLVVLAVVSLVFHFLRGSK